MSSPTDFSGQQRVVVDWDGTLVPIEWPERPEVMFKDAAEALRAFLSAGYEVVIFTTRLAPREIDEATPRERADKEGEVRYIRRVLDSYGLQEVGIWRNSWKPGGVNYIDDKAIKFDGDWKAVERAVLKGGT